MVSSTGGGNGASGDLVPRLRRAGNAAVQHSDTRPRRNWATACASAFDALAVRERTRDRVEDAFGGGARIVRVRHRATDDEHVRAGARGRLRRTDARLVVARAVVEADARNDRDEVAARVVHASDLVCGAHHTMAPALDRGCETRVELTRVRIAGEHGD